MTMTKRLVFATLLLGCGGAGQMGGMPRDSATVNGNYDVRYEDKVTVKVDLGGAVREQTHDGMSGTVDFGMYNGQPLTLDLASFCAKPEVKCPSESFWTKVSVREPNRGASSLQQLDVIDNEQHTLDAGVRAPALSGLIDHAQDDKFLLGLGATGASTANCLALGLSLAGGRFTRAGERFVTSTVYRTPKGQPCDPDAGVMDAGLASDGGGDAGSDGGVAVSCAAVQVRKREFPDGAVVDGIAEGKILVGYAGACAFGPAVVGATVTLETNFTGTRTGDFDPPPFTPAPQVLPDAGVDGGLVVGDAGP